jgi:methionyl-tRNA formyltransferase
VHTVDRWIRACTPAPGAWTVIDGERLRVGVPETVVVDASAQPGRIDVSKSSVQIGCTGGYLVLGDVQPKGKKAMPARDWVRGFRGDLTAIEMG